MRKTSVFTVSALAFMLLLLLGSSHALAACDHRIFVEGTYDFNSNGWWYTLTIVQPRDSEGQIIPSSGDFAAVLDDPDSFIESGSSSFKCNSVPATITFTRQHRGGAFTQVYSGTIDERPLNTAGDTRATRLSGTFDHNGTGTYGWHAQHAQTADEVVAVSVTYCDPKQDPWACQRFMQYCENNGGGLRSEPSGSISCWKY